MYGRQNSVVCHISVYLELLLAFTFTGRSFESLFYTCFSYVIFKKFAPYRCVFKIKPESRECACMRSTSL